MRYYKPIEIARMLNISTSSLRQYESWGAVPAPDRGANGYRLYTKEHVAYFRCLRAMFAGFGAEVTCQILQHIQKHEIDDAFWLVSREQSLLLQEKTMAEQTLALLRDPELSIVRERKHKKKKMTIGEIAELTKVQPSAIRHWEKEGLLLPERDDSSGYRIYTHQHVRQILIIRTLRKSIFFLDSVQKIMQGMEHNETIEGIVTQIHERNRNQLAGIHQLMELCEELGLRSW